MQHSDRSKEAFLGILMLDTQFERVLGDAGNPASYPVPVRLERVHGAGSLEVVRDGRPSDNLIKAFVKASRSLEAQGAIALTSTCGFLISIEDEIASAVSIPVLVSALSMYREIRLAHPKGPVGIITASKAALGDAALAAAGIQKDNVIIEGMEDCPAFAEAILRPKNRQATVISFRSDRARDRDKSPGHGAATSGNRGLSSRMRQSSPLQACHPVGDGQAGLLTP